MRVHGEFQPIWVLEEAELTDTQVLLLGRLLGKKVEDLLKNSSFENDIQYPVFSLKGTYSHRHEGGSNEDAGSFDLYRIVIICSSEMISKLLCLDLCFLYPFEYTADFTDAKLWEKIGKKRNFLLCEWCKRAVSVAEVSGGGNGNAPPMSSESQIFRGNFLSVEQSCQTSPDNA